MSDGTDQSHSQRPGRVPASRYVAFLVVAVAGTAADLISKEIVFGWPGELGTIHYWWWEGHAGIQTSLNEGALFGIGYGKVWLFAAISVVAAIAIPAWLFVGRAAHDWVITFSLAAMMGGVLGNLYDRLGLSGEVWPDFDERAGTTVYAVRDWILWQVNDQWRWPNFNIADALLVVGAGVFFSWTMFLPSAPKEENA